MKKTLPILTVAATGVLVTVASLSISQKHASNSQAKPHLGQRQHAATASAVSTSSTATDAASAASVKASGAADKMRGLIGIPNGDPSSDVGHRVALPPVDPNGPLPGYMLIADRGNSRLLIVTPDKKIVWHMELAIPGPRNENSRGADDAFLTPDKKHIIINEEENHALAIIDIATKKIVWTYGHPGEPGVSEGYLHTPDDAYELPDGTITVADIRNQRILFINQDGHVIKQYGVTGRRYHQPPQMFAAPNGDTPLPDGGMLVTEIGGSYADRLDKNGTLVYKVHFKDIPYPSDTQLLPNGNLLTVDYNTPGRLEEVTTKGQVVWSYYRSSGSGMLANPSLAIRLPNGFVATNDDYNDRVVIINPKTNQIVWQYGHTNQPGTGDGYLNVPDGVDFIPATWQLPTP